MKLAAVHPKLDFSIEDLIDKQVKITRQESKVEKANLKETSQKKICLLLLTLTLFTEQAFATCSTSMPTMGISPDCLQYNPIKQDLVYASELTVSQLDMGLRRAISAPIAMPETFFDPSSFNVISLLLVQEIQIYTNFVLFSHFDAF